MFEIRIIKSFGPQIKIGLWRGRRRDYFALTWREKVCSIVFFKGSNFFIFFFFFFSSFYSPEVLRIGDTRKVVRIEYIDEEQLVVIMSGKQHCVRLIPTGALDGYGVEWIKLTDTKGCSTCCIGKPTRLNRHVLCVAMKRHVLIYEITRDKGRHRRLREIALDFNPQSLDVRGDKLFVGFPSTFGVFSLVDDTASCKQFFLFSERILRRFNIEWTSIRLIDWLIDWSMDFRLTDEWWIDWLIDWMIYIIQCSWFIFLLSRLIFSSYFFYSPCECFLLVGWGVLCFQIWLRGISTGRKTTPHHFRVFCCRKTLTP